MELTSEIEVVNTRRKLKMLEEHFEASKKHPDAKAPYQQLTRQSLKRLINQLTEEFVRFESRSVVKALK